MTDRRDRLPPEFRGLNPEEFVDIYELPDGSLVAPTRDAIGAQVESGRYGYAFDLMRFQLMRGAKAALRKAGCNWRRSDALWLRGIDNDAATDLAAMVEDASEFVRGLGLDDPDARRALETLLTLHWQSQAVAEAGSDAERDTLRRMALASASLGFMSAHSGIEGAVPSLRQVMALAQAAKVQHDAGERGRDTLRNKADQWRGPFAHYVDEWLNRKKPTERTHGMATSLVSLFREARPDVRLSFDLASRAAAKQIDAFIASRSGE